MSKKASKKELKNKVNALKQKRYVKMAAKRTYERPAEFALPEDEKVEEAEAAPVVEAVAEEEKTED